MYVYIYVYVHVHAHIRHSSHNSRTKMRTSLMMKVRRVREGQCKISVETKRALER